MTITYRTAGAWGAGLGADLSAVQIDNNFWDLQGRVTILEAWPTPAAIEEFEIDGNQLTVIMDDATTRGPYTLPTFVPSSFVWAPGMNVVPGQMFAQGSTIYTVTTPHTTVDPFDAGESSTDGDYYQEFITVDGALPTGGATGQSLVKSSSSDYAVTWASINNTLVDLSDVDASGAADGDILQYVGTADVWANIALDGSVVPYDNSGGFELGSNNVQDAIQELESIKIPWTSIGVDVQAFDAQLFSNIPQNSQSAAYTTVLTDGGKHILHPSADTTARIFTIQSNGFAPYPVGTAITFVNQNSAGVVTIAIAAPDTMRLAGAGTLGSRTLAANNVATALKITTTEWIISGSAGLT